MYCIWYPFSLGSPSDRVTVGRNCLPMFLFGIQSQLHSLQQSSYCGYQQQRSPVLASGPFWSQAGLCAASCGTDHCAVSHENVANVLTNKKRCAARAGVTQSPQCCGPLMRPLALAPACSAARLAGCVKAPPPQQSQNIPDSYQNPITQLKSICP